jgi:hypothetical protein
MTTRGWWSEWKARRALHRRAVAFLRSLQVEPNDVDVKWLADRGTRGDQDHARWELRYARRALGLLAAQRDALDDRTASAVARELGVALARDPAIDSAKRPIAQKQLNSRLRAYGEVLNVRNALEATSTRLGRALFSFTAGSGQPSPADYGRAGEILAGYLEDANVALRKEFGVAALPEHVPPSEIVTAKSR